MKVVIDRQGDDKPHDASRLVTISLSSHRVNDAYAWWCLMQRQHSGIIVITFSCECDAYDPLLSLSTS